MVYLTWFAATIAAAIASCQGKGTGSQDLITQEIPGLNFKPTFKQYAGYLNATGGKNIFYWLVESQGDPSKDPILLWLQGGPGCSGVGTGFVLELGPFHVNPDGHSLWENVFAWNKFATVLFIESPSGVGFSYSSPKNDTTDDDLAAYHNFHALRDFFYNKFPQYQSHDFYITGESYAGVYIPTLTKLIIDGVSLKTFPNVLRGVAIGNGYLSEKVLFNSAVNLFYYHGLAGVDEWNAVLQACCANASIRADECDFQLSVTRSRSCSQAIRSFGEGVDDPYNMYQECYTREGYPRPNFSRFINRKRWFKRQPIGRFRNAPTGTSDMSHQLNYDSTDANFGFPCWADETKYFNNIKVKKVLHVAEHMLNRTWCSCCNIPYYWKYDDMSQFFSYIIKNSKIRILIYNGDVDLVCDFLGDQWFVEREVAPQNNLTVLKKRKPWIYRNQIAGYVKRFERLDLLTVKGSGHMVPEDRAGPALQMIVNFVRNTGDYSTPTGIDVTPKPLK